MSKDIRWLQRLDNYSKALKQLGKAVEISLERELSDLEKQGVIQAFEFTHELAWKVIKDFYENQGTSDIQGSRDAARLAFKRGLIINGQIWMEMIESRNRTSHTYDDNVMEEIVDKIVTSYYNELIFLHEKLSERRNHSDDGFGLPRHALDAIIAVFHKHPEVSKAVIYGSRALGTHKTGSDIDIVLEGEELGIEALSKISNDLENLSLPYSFDLANKNNIENQSLIDHINRVGRVLYSKQR